MTCNVGGTDRTVRFTVGIVAIVAGFFLADYPGWQIAAFVLGGIALLTAAVRFCPVNRMLRINSCRTETRRT